MAIELSKKFDQSQINQILNQKELYISNFLSSIAKKDKNSQIKHFSMENSSSNLNLKSPEQKGNISSNKDISENKNEEKL